MDFFQRQDIARKNTKFLVVYFALAVIGITVAIYLAAIVIFNGAQAKRHSRYAYEDYRQQQLVLWNPQLFAGVAIATLAVIGCGSAVKISELASGGGAVAKSLGGRLLHTNTTDPQERKLLNVIEEMAIASGVPMPQVYLLDGEMGINAFAAGHTPSDAAIGVTRGCVQSLTRDELQGVIGHEFSHILNGDMKLNLRLMGIIFGILCLTVIGRILLRVRSSGRNQNPLPFLGLVLIVFGSIGVFFGRLIQAAVSRQREFLADASAVQFTRNPLGLSGALQKIGGSIYGSKLESAHAQEASHMFFSNGLRPAFLNAFATHPPLEDRIKAIDATWDGKFKAIKPIVAEEPPLRRAASHPPFPFPFPSMPGMPGATGSSPVPMASGLIAASAALANLGEPTTLHLRYAEEMRESFSENLRAATREPMSAVAVIYAMLLSREAGIQAEQLKELAVRHGMAAKHISALKSEVASVAARARLPLVNLCLPALRELEASDYQRFVEALHWLIESDQQIDLFEFALEKILRRHLAPHFGQPRRGVVQFYSIKPLLPDCAVLLSALARVGSSDEVEVRRAVEAGAPFLRAAGGGIALLPLDCCGLEEVDAVLDRLTQASPQIKKNVLEACAHVAAADGVMHESEAELLRAIADTLDCPLPPFVPAE